MGSQMGTRRSAATHIVRFDFQTDAPRAVHPKLLANGANGIRDIEGKVAREAMSECGQRASFKAFGVRRANYLRRNSRPASLERLDPRLPRYRRILRPQIGCLP